MIRLNWIAAIFLVWGTTQLATAQNSTNSSERTRKPVDANVSEQLPQANTPDRIKRPDLPTQHADSTRTNQPVRVSRPESED